MCGHCSDVLRGVGLPSGQCAVTLTPLLSAACPGVGRRLQAYGATQVNRLLVHGCKSSVLGVGCGNILWQPEQGAAFAVSALPHRRVIETPGRYACLLPAAFLVLAVLLIPAQDIHGALRS